MAVPSDRLVVANWQAAGLLSIGGIPTRSTIYASFDAADYGNGSSDASGDIQDAIDACPDDQVVYLGPGVFRVDSILYLNKSITLRGAGAGVTTLTYPAGAERSPGMDVQPSETHTIILVGLSQFPHFQNTGLKTLVADAAKGDTTIQLDDTSGLVVGDYYLLSEDQFNEGAWIGKPDSSGVANLYENWADDKVRWALHRRVGHPSAITSSDASTDRITTSAAHGLSGGQLIYITGHSATFSPSASDGLYRVRDVISTTVFTLQPSSWDGSLVNITSGGTGGTVTANRPGDNLAPGPVDQTNSALGWFARGYGHVYGEIKEIASINSGTDEVTFTSPLISSYRTSRTAQLSTSDTGFVEMAGVEHMTLHRGARGAVSFLNAAKCWAYGLEIYEWYGHAIDISTSFRVHIEGCHVRYSAWLYPGGGSYAVGFMNQSTECLVWNSIFVDSNKSVVANAAGAGSVFAYNHCDDQVIFNYQDWQEVGINGSHFPGSHHMLFEGNYAPNADSDFTHGSSHCHTFIRNHLSGARESYAGLDNARCIGLAYGSLEMSFVGNVLGVEGAMSGWLTDAGTSFGSDSYIYKFGYDPVEFPQEADLDVLRTGAGGTTCEEDNWDWLNEGFETEVDPADVPESYFLSGIPDFFADNGYDWPWVTPDGTEKTLLLPAKARYDADEPLNLDFGPGDGGGGVATFVDAEWANGTSTAPDLTYAATSGNFLFLLLTFNGSGTSITPPTGWTALPSMPVDIFGNFTYSAYWKVASGSDDYTFSLSHTETWTLAVAEWSGMGAAPTLLDSAAQAQNTNVPESGTLDIAENALVIAGLADTFGTVTSPTGFTDVVPSPGSDHHYGTPFAMMGAISFRVATSGDGSTANPQWTLNTGRFSGCGAHSFTPDSGTDVTRAPAAGALSLSGSVSVVSTGGRVPDTRALVLTGRTPSIAFTGGGTKSPSLQALALTGHTPTTSFFFAGGSKSPSAGALGLTGYAPLPLAGATFEGFLDAEARQEVIVAWIRPRHSVSSWSATAHPGTWQASVPGLVGTAQVAGGVFLQVIAVFQESITLTAVSSLSACAASLGSWYWDVAASLLYVHTTTGASPATFQMLAVERELTVSTVPIVLNDVNGDPSTGRFYHPWITSEIGSLLVESVDPTTGRMVFPDGVLTLRSENAFLHTLIASNSTYTWENIRVLFAIGGSYNGMSLLKSQYQNIGAYRIYRINDTDDTSVSFGMYPVQKLIDVLSAPTPIFESEFPNLGDSVRGKRKPIVYGRVWLSPPLVDTSVSYGRYLLADAGYQTMTSVDIVEAMPIGGGQRIPLTLGQDFIYDLTACTVTVINPDYAHQTHELVVRVTGKPGGIRGYLSTFGEIAYDMLTSLARIPATDIDVAAFTTSTAVQTAELAVFCADGRNVSSVFSTSEPGYPSLERSAHGIIFVNRDGKFSTRMWLPPKDLSTAVVLRRDQLENVKFRHREERLIVSQVTVYYNRDWSQDASWSVYSKSDLPRRYLAQTTDVMELYTYLVAEANATAMADRFAILFGNAYMQADLSELGAKALASLPHDVVLLTYSPAPSTSGAYTDRVFEYVRLEKFYAPQLTVRALSWDVEATGLARNGGVWMATAAPNYAAALAAARELSGFWCDAAGDPGSGGIFVGRSKWV